MNGRPWSQLDIEVVRLFYPTSKTSDIAKALGRSEYSVFGKASGMGLKKTAEFLSSPAAGRLDGIRGSAHRFPKGHVPANKGKKGYSAPGTEATRFKKGSKPATWLPIGSERISSDGYLQRKMTDTGYPPKDWVSVHTLIWTAANGPVPAGHALVFKDGNKMHISLDNLEVLTRAELMRRNSIHNYPPEIVHAMQLVGALNRKINARHRKTA